jgi:ribosomal protein S18 acetylase RimI-like enzyme
MLHIRTATPDEWGHAFDHALAHSPAADRAARVGQCVSLLQSGILEPQGIFIAHNDGVIAGAQVCVPLKGAACLFWLPATTGSVAEALVQTGLDWCRSRGCKIAQAQANANEMARTDALLQRGFRPIAHLCHMERSLNDLPPADESLRYVHFHPPIVSEFAATLERTYIDTLDCPELNGRRTIAEILEGHQGQGGFDPHFWWLAYANDKPAGVAMLAEMPDGFTWELAYIGVVPEFRRHGIGRALTLHALHALRATPATRMNLIVDTRNVPARRLYESLGFAATETSTAFLYFFG